MRKQTLSLLAALSILAIQTQGLADELSVFGLFNGSEFYTQTSSWKRTSDAYVGSGFGALWEFWLYPKVDSPPFLALETGIMKVNREYGQGLEADKLSMIQIPVLLRRKWHFLSVGLGAYFGWGFGLIESSTLGRETFSQLGLKQLDVGYTGALAFHLPVFGPYNQDSHPDLFVDFRYLHSLLNQSTDGQLKKGFAEVQLLLGFRFCMTKEFLVCNPVR